MNKKTIALFLILSVSLSTIFGTSTEKSNKDSKLCFEAQVGYSTNSLVSNTDSDASDYEYKFVNNGISVGGKATLNTGSFVNLTTSAKYNVGISGNYELKAYSTLLTDLYGDSSLDSITLFIGAEKQIMAIRRLVWVNK